jgi:hypothetical protein
VGFKQFFTLFGLIISAFLTVSSHSNTLCVICKEENFFVVSFADILGGNDTQKSPSPLPKFFFFSSFPVVVLRAGISFVL